MSSTVDNYYDPIEAINRLIIGPGESQYYLVPLPSINPLGNVVTQTDNGEALVSKNINTLPSSFFMGDLPSPQHRRHNHMNATRMKESMANYQENSESDSDEEEEDDKGEQLSNFFNKSYLGKFYLASLTIIGLFVVYRVIQRTK
jgi:hypothetical protein